MNDVAEFVTLSVSDVAEALCKKDNILILFHHNPDGDATGSSFALKSFLESVGKRAICLCPDEIPERLRFISEGLQERVTVDSLPKDFIPDLTLSVDTASPSQLGTLYERYQGKIDVMIDHHGKGTPYADNYIVPTASSCGEVLYGVIGAVSKRLGADIPLRTKSLIYTAISSDTGCFRYSNVAPSTHNVAAELIESGVDAADINHKLFGMKSLKQMQVEHAGFERMNLHLGGKLAIITFPYDLKEQYGAENEHLETLVDVARCIRGVEVAAVIKQPEAENRFRVSMRSSCDLDVSEICALYGGGGHVRAAGCTIVADSILSAEMTVVLAIEQRMLENE